MLREIRLKWIPPFAWDAISAWKCVHIMPFTPSYHLIGRRLQVDQTA